METMENANELSDRVETEQETLNLNSVELAKRAIGWLEEMNDMRSKSGNTNGRLSGKMKKKIQLLKKAVHTLTGRTEACGDSAYLKIRNTKLSVQLRTAKEVFCLKAFTELKHSQKIFKSCR